MRPFFSFQGVFNREDVSIRGHRNDFVVVVFIQVELLIRAYVPYNQDGELRL